jgi:hypothetical protein
MNDYSILHLIIHAKSSIKFNTVLEKSDRLLAPLNPRTLEAYALLQQNSKGKRNAPSLNIMGS